MSLWKISGSKTWEVDISTDEHRSEQIVGLGWSPDGTQPETSFMPSFETSAHQDRA